MSIVDTFRTNLSFEQVNNISLVFPKTDEKVLYLFLLCCNKRNACIVITINVLFLDFIYKQV